MRKRAVERNVLSPISGCVPYQWKSPGYATVCRPDSFLIQLSNTLSTIMQYLTIHTVHYYFHIKGWSCAGI